jgi:hypothetical protein
MLCHRRQVFRDSPDTINQPNHRRLDHSGSPHHKFVEMVCNGCESRSTDPTARATIVVVLRCCCRNLRRRVGPSLTPGILCNQSESFRCRFAADAAAGKISCNTRLCCVLGPSPPWLALPALSQTPSGSSETDDTHPGPCRRRPVSTAALGPGLRTCEGVDGWLDQHGAPPAFARAGSSSQPRCGFLRTTNFINIINNIRSW